MEEKAHIGTHFNDFQRSPTNPTLPSGRKVSQKGTARRFADLESEGEAKVGKLGSLPS